MKTAIIGIGNPLWGDEGLGVYLAQNPDPGLPRDVDVIDGGTAGVGLLRFFETYDRLILLDAVKHGGEPGDVTAFVASDEMEMAPCAAPSAHGLVASFVLRLCRALNLRTEVIVIGCEPEKCRLGDGLSDTVKRSIPRIWREVERYLSNMEENHGRKKKNINR